MSKENSGTDIIADSATSCVTESSTIYETGSKCQKDSEDHVIIRMCHTTSTEESKSNRAVKGFDPIHDILNKLHSEVKAAAESGAMEIWLSERCRLLQTMAGLIGISEQELEERLSMLPNRKGRPKRRKNPWHDLFTDD